jgi:hypothetical protein
MNQKPDNWSGEDDADDSIVMAYTKGVSEGLAGTHVKSVQAAMIVLRQRLLRVSYSLDNMLFPFIIFDQGTVFLTKKIEDWMHANKLNQFIVNKLCKTDRWALESCTTISPLVLFLPHSSCRRLNRACMLRMSRALGTSRPPTLFALESCVWKVLLSMVGKPSMIRQPRTWFEGLQKTDYQALHFFKQPTGKVLGVFPGLVALDDVQKRLDLHPTYEPYACSTLRNVYQLGTCARSTCLYIVNCYRPLHGPGALRRSQRRSMELPSRIRLSRNYVDTSRVSLVNSG